MSGYNPAHRPEMPCEDGERRTMGEWIEGYIFTRKWLKTASDEEREAYGYPPREKNWFKRLFSRYE